LRIFFEVLVLCHHLRPTYGSFDEKLNFVFGTVAVGGFLLLSGYGVGVRTREAGDAYRRRLLTRRAPMMYARILLVDLLYLIPFFLIGNTFASASSAIVSVLYLPFAPGFVALSHWVYFIADLFVYYLVFGAFSMLFRKKENGYMLSVICFTALLAVLIAVLSVINYRTGSIRYMRAALLFPIGLTIAGCEKTFFTKVNVTPLKKWISFGVLFALGCVPFFFEEMRFVSEYITPIPFALAAAVAMMGCEPKGKALSYSAGLVIGVYLAHEAFFRIFRYYYPSMNKWLSMLLITLCAVACAVLSDLAKRGVRHLIMKREQKKGAERA